MKPKPGPKTTADLSVIHVEPRSHRLRPPAHLDAKAAEIFCDLVMSCPVSHFTAADAHLLAIYSQVVLVSRESAGDPDLLAQWERSTKLVATLAPKLRLCPSSRSDAKTVARQSTGYQPSYYERVGTDG